MKSFADAIEAAEKVSAKKEKMKALSDINPHEQRLIVEALNPYRVFGIKKWQDQPNRHATRDKELNHEYGYDMSSFYALLDNLHDRKLTGDAARAAVQDTLSWYTKRTAKYLARVIRKDLECGAQDTTFRKVYPNLIIPSFDVMLAKKMDEKYEWKFPCFAEAKYDGQRIIAIVNVKSKDVRYLSRSGKDADFCNGIFDKELLRIASMRTSYDTIVFDGEVMASSFQESAMAKGIKNADAKKMLRYYAFDWMLLSMWSSRSCTKLSQRLRSTTLRTSIEDSKTVLVKSTISKYLTSENEANKFYREIVGAGYEGLIIKDLNADYVWDRSPAWTKWKPIITLDLEIVEVLKGSGKYSTTCGALRLVGEDENGNKIDTKMGSGMSNEDRNYFWNNRNKLVGKTVEVEAQEITKAKNSETFSLRFPVFKKIREDK